MQVEIIMKHSEISQYSTGRTIYKEDDLVKYIYYILSGEVELCQQQSKEQIERKLSEKCNENVDKYFNKIKYSYLLN